MAQSVVGGVTSSSVYYGNGVRRSHTVNGATTTYRYDVLASLPVVIQDGTYSYVYGLDLISMTDGSGTQHYFSYDGLGSLSDLTDATGAVTDTFAYDVFGAVTTRTGTTPNVWKFTGEQADDGTGDSGYYFLRARHYDPAIGRFVSRDKVKFSQRYAYAGNNPAVLTDPSGMCAICRWAGNRALDVVDVAVHTTLNPENITNGNLGNQVLAMTIAATSSCSGRFNAGSATVYEGCGGVSGWFLSKAGQEAFTVGSFVFGQGDVGGTLLQHELRHVSQYDKWGGAFLPAYVGAQIVFGYRDNPFENHADRDPLFSGRGGADSSPLAGGRSAGGKE